MPDATADRVREERTEEGESAGTVGICRSLKRSGVLAMLAPLQAVQRDTPRP